MEYWIRYRELTGLRMTERTVWFETIQERFEFYKSGVEVVGFGQGGCDGTQKLQRL
jgi:hypothetical protein